MVGTVRSHLATLGYRFQNLTVYSHLAMAMAWGSVCRVGVYRRRGTLQERSKRKRVGSDVEIVVQVASTLALSSSPAVAIVAEELSLNVIAVTSPHKSLRGSREMKCLCSTFHDPRNNRQLLATLLDGDSK